MKKAILVLMLLSFLLTACAKATFEVTLFGGGSVVVTCSSWYYITRGEGLVFMCDGNSFNAVAVVRIQNEEE